MSQSQITLLLERAKAILFPKIVNIRADLLVKKKQDAVLMVNDEIDLIIQSCVDEREDICTQVLLLCCQENPDLFTKEPVDYKCISENGEPGLVTAQHCVYHNVYELLQSLLRQEFETWYEKNILAML